MAKRKRITIGGEFCRRERPGDKQLEVIMVLGETGLESERRTISALLNEDLPVRDGTELP